MTKSVLLVSSLVHETRAAQNRLSADSSKRSSGWLIACGQRENWTAVVERVFQQNNPKAEVGGNQVEIQSHVRYWPLEEVRI